MDLTQQRLSLTIFIFITYAFFAMSVTLIGPSLPFIGDELKISLSHMDLLAGAFNIGLIFTVLFGLLSDKYGKQITLMISLLIGVLALFTIPYSKAYIIALTLYVMLGVGLAFFEASSNPLISIMYFQRKAFALNLLHFFWGFGCFLGPLIASRVILRFDSWRPAYLISALIFIPLLIYSVAIKNKIQRIEDDKEIIIQKKGKSIFSKELILLGVSSFFFFGAELGPNAWLVPFLMTERDFSFSLASITLSIFWIFVAIGRLLFRGAPDQLGYRRSMIIFSISTGVSLLLGVFLKPTYVVISFWALSGLCFAPILPTLLAWANQIFPERGGVASGTIFSLGVLGAVFSPWFIGVISESIGLKNGITFLALSAFLILTGIISLRDKFESRNKR